MLITSYRAARLIPYVTVNLCVLALAQTVAQSPLAIDSPRVKFVQTSYAGHPSTLDKGWYVSPMEAWVVDRAGIVRTRDGGRTWRLFHPPESEAVGEIYDIEFEGSNRAWFSASSGVWESHDKGEAWNHLAENARLPAVSYNGHLSMTVAPLSTGYWSYTSQGDGDSWYSCVPQTGIESKMRPVVSIFISVDKGWSIGMTESHPGYTFDVERTRDGGCSWETVWAPPINLDDYLNSIYFLNRDQGWIGGDGPVYSTRDGGRHWQKLTEIEGIRITSICFNSPSRGWLLAYDNGQSGGLFSTRDGGHTWHRVFPQDFDQHIEASLPENWNRGQLALMLSRRF